MEIGSGMRPWGQARTEGVGDGEGCGSYVIRRQRRQPPPHLPFFLNPGAMRYMEGDT